MDSYDSDSSDGEDQGFRETATVLGYPSKEETDDLISQLGGTPVSLYTVARWFLLIRC
jgi:pre-rRNA-processing protein TSR4